MNGDAVRYALICEKSLSESDIKNLREIWERDHTRILAGETRLLPKKIRLVRVPEWPAGWMPLFDPPPDDPDICPDCSGTGKRPCDLTQCQCCDGYGRYSLSNAVFRERMRRNAEWHASQPWQWRLKRYVWSAIRPAREQVREWLR